MSARVMFSRKPLSLPAMAAMAVLSASIAEALVLPPQPLSLSASWDCQSKTASDWLCDSAQHSDYDPFFDAVTRQEKYPLQQTEAVLANRQSIAPDTSLNPPTSNPKPIRRAPAQSRYTAPPPQPQQAYRTADQTLPRFSGHQSPAVLPEGQGLNRLLNADHGSFVVQWQAAYSPKPLQALQQNYPVLQQATIVHYRRNKKDWYVLLEGPFKDRNTAMAFLNLPPRPDMMEALYPWTRSVASIQKLNIIRPDSRFADNEEKLADQYSLPVGSPQPADTMFASVTPAYPKLEQTRQAYGASPEQDFNEALYQQTSNRQASYQPENNVRRRPAVRYSPDNTGRYVSERPHLSDSLLNAPPGSYTIQWLASNKRQTLDKAKQRFAHLGNTLVVRYQKRGRDWYALVSPPFSSLTDARSALSHPVYAQMATQLYPRIRSIDSLRQINSMSVPAIQHERFVDYNDSLSEVRVSLIDSAAQTSPVGLPVSNPFLPEQPEQNILNGSGKRYTIQWFTADRPESIEEMKQRFPELSSAVTVHYRKHQKDWYVLVQGQYRSSSEALSMLKSPEIKDAVRVLHPWTRSITSLKKLNTRES